MIFNLDMIKRFESDFKAELNKDEKYLPIYNKLVVLLGDIMPTTSYIDEKLSYQQKINLDVDLQIHKRYAQEIEQNNNELKEFIAKHKKSIESFQKEKITKLQAINLEQRNILKEFDMQKERHKEIYNEKLLQFEQQLKRELSQFDKEKGIARKFNQEQTQEIELEKKGTILNLEKIYASAIHKVNTNLEIFEIDKQKELVDNEAHFVEIKDENDKIYLNIKNTYHQVTKEFNLSINKLNKSHLKAKESLEMDYQEQIKPVHKRLEQLNNDYLSSIEKAKKAYQLQLIDLDHLFNVQKEEYEVKKARIIHQSNEAITLLNSKLSAYRESITTDKIDQSRSFRDRIKVTEETRQKDKINHDLTRVLNALDNDLNKQILRTHKDVIAKQKKLQQNLFDHDVRHLREMNDWRLNRNLLSYEYKQDLAKIDLNFNHNLSLSKKHIALIELTHKYQLFVINTTLNQDLLPLENQLSIQSMVQERELNLLNNDQHIANYTSKLNVARINHKYQLMVEKEKLSEQIAKLDYDLETQVVLITTQLELEKTKSRRDFVLGEQDIRADIARAIFEKNKQYIYKEYTDQLDEITSRERINEIQKKYSIDAVRLDQQKKYQQQEFLLQETKSKHQEQESHQKALRLMKLYLNELNFNQRESEFLFYLLRFYYQKHLFLKNIIKDLYLLPSHPEVFKKILKKCIELLDSFKAGISDIILSFKKLNDTYYTKKIEDLTGYKYMLKHEDVMNFFEQELSKIQKQKQEITKDITKLEQQFFINQQNLEKQEQFIFQLKKITAKIQSGTIKTKTKHQEIKENQKLISNHEKEMKLIKQRLSKIEKAMDKKHTSLTPFDRQVNLIKQNMIKEQKVLDTHKEKESNFYQSYHRKNQHIFDRMSSDFSLFTDTHIKFIKTLDETLYVTDSLLYNEEKKLDKEHQLFGQKIVKHQQILLNHFFVFYEVNDRKQDEIINDFNKAQNHLTKTLDKNKLSVLERIKNQQSLNVKLQEKDMRAHQESNKDIQSLKVMNDRKELMIINNHIKSLEVNLESYLGRMKQELRLINENQIQIANQTLQEYEKQHLAINNNHFRQNNKFDSKLEAEEKSFQSLDTSISNKNQGLLMRFEQNRLKQLEHFQEKNNFYLNSIEKAKQSNQNDHKVYDQEVSLMQESRSYEIRNMKEHTKRFTSKSEKAQHRVFKSEYTLLRKNYRFKLKSLNLK